MKRALLIITVLLISIASSAQQITKSFIANDFSGITASNLFYIELTKSDVESVVVIADKEVMQYVVAKVVMGQLNLNLDTYRMPRSMKKNIKLIKVKVNMKRELSWLSISGASDLVTSSSFKPVTFKGQISGASSVSGLDIECESAKISLSGASDLSLKGNVNFAEYELSGACTAIINQDITNLSVECSGASTMNLTGRIINLEAEISGAAGLKLKGTGDNMEAEVTGASKLNAIEFVVNDADIDISGVSKAVVNVQKSLEAEVSGGSSIEYKGSPIINKASVNSISSIRKIN
ncbi:MAG: DUF2807 domain-containing protein [Bacteroidales bacterium]|nr:DUF2807 domain-containing protein [Bacteroidales bacterium]